MKQAESSTPQKPASTLKLIAIVCLRILGFRKKQFNEDEFEQLTGIQVGIACMLALIGFTAILAMLSILAVKTMS
jgi:hypothetical protein